MISAYEHGQNAARHGKHIQACPFDPGTTQWREWRAGFMAYRPKYREGLRRFDEWTTGFSSARVRRPEKPRRARPGHTMRQPGPL